MRVRMVGVEPTRLSALDPKSSAAANYATSAYGRLSGLSHLIGVTSLVFGYCMRDTPPLRLLYRWWDSNPQLLVLETSASAKLGYIGKDLFSPLRTRSLALRGSSD